MTQPRGDDVLPPELEVDPEIEKILTYPDVPELDKRSAAHKESQSIGSFLDWLIENHSTQTVFVRDDEEELDPEERETGEIDVGVCDLHPEQLLHEYFDVDRKKADEELNMLLAYQRVVTTWFTIRKELKLSNDKFGDKSVEAEAKRQLLAARKEIREELGVLPDTGATT